MATLQKAEHQSTCPSLFPRIVANIQLLWKCVEQTYDPATISQDEWSPIVALWDSIQSFCKSCLDNYWLYNAVGTDSLPKPTVSTMAVYAINGIILLNKIHSHLPHVNRISTDDLLLMGLCCLNLHDFFKRHDLCARNYPELADVMVELARRSVESLKENRFQDKDQGWQEMDAMLDMLLEALCGLLVDM
ncbi:hypothetical protein BGZ72_008034, partial [Mortierella alpina]